MNVQVMFECPVAFRDRLVEESLKRGMPIKRLIMEAVERRIFDQSGERKHWGEMFMEYMRRCPEVKVKLMQEMIQCGLSK